LPPLLQENEESYEKSSQNTHQHIQNPPKIPSPNYVIGQPKRITNRNSPIMLSLHLRNPSPDAAANQRLTIRALEKLLLEEGFNNQKL
jgi:hypothetical protein